MKRSLLSLFLFIPLFLTVSANANIIANQSAVITGELGYKDQKVYLVADLISFSSSYDKATDSAAIDSNGHFILKGVYSPNYNYTLYIGDRVILTDIFCKPGDSIVIFQTSIEKYPKVAFDKGGAISFYNDLFTKFQLDETYKTYFKEGRWQESYAILDKRSETQAGLLNIVSSLLADYPALKREAEDIIRYQASTYKLQLLSYFYFDDNDNILIKDKHCLDFIDNLQFDNINNKSASARTGVTGELTQKNVTCDLTHACINFLNLYLDFPYKLWKMEMKKSYALSMDERLALRFDFCKARLSGCLKDYGIYFSIASLFSFYSDSTALGVVEKQLKYLCEFGTDKRFADVSTRIYNKKRATSTGHIAPYFTLPDINNDNISLTDFKGKTVYLEFTGSWCIYCKKEIPAYLELQKKLKGNPDIQFVSIWLESNEKPEDVWVKYVNGTGLSGSHLYSSSQFNGKAPRAYQVEGAPTFFIIDKYGKIFSSNAKHPSEKGVYEDLIRAAGL